MQSRELVKLYYRIGEVSEIVGVQPHVLRYWETEFRSIRPQKSSKGQRVYSRRDVEKLLRVKDLLRNQGFTIAGARKRLSEPSESAPSSGSAGAVAPAAVSPAAVSPAAVSPAAVSPPAGSAPSIASIALSPPAVVAPAAVVTPAVSLVDLTGPPQLARVGMQPAPTEQALSQRPVSASLSEPRAKDMRRALLGLRQDLMRMLAELNRARAPERREH